MRGIWTKNTQLQLQQSKLYNVIICLSAEYEFSYILSLLYALICGTSNTPTGKKFYRVNFCHTALSSEVSCIITILENNILLK